MPPKRITCSEAPFKWVHSHLHRQQPPLKAHLMTPLCSLQGFLTLLPAFESVTVAESCGSKLSTGSICSHSEDLCPHVSQRLQDKVFPSLCCWLQPTTRCGTHGGPLYLDSWLDESIPKWQISSKSNSALCIQLLSYLFCFISGFCFVVFVGHPCRNQAISFHPLWFSCVLPFCICWVNMSFVVRRSTQPDRCYTFYTS